MIVSLCIGCADGDGGVLQHSVVGLRPYGFHNAQDRKGLLVHAKLGVRALCPGGKRSGTSFLG